MPNPEIAIKPLIRLNPKLTKRQYILPPTAAPPENLLKDILANEKVDKNLVDAISFKPVDELSSLDSNQLIHDGEWIVKKFDSVGKMVYGTGLWSCCGSSEQFSFYCPSIDDKINFRNRLESEKEEKENHEKYLEFVKKFQEDKHGAERLQQQRRAEGLDIELEPLKEVSAEQRACNAPMLISWIYKHIDDEFTVSSGLSLMLENVQSGVGCSTMMQYDCIRCILKAQSKYHGNHDIQCLSVAVLRKLLDCNITRPSLIGDTKILKVVFSVGHSYMENSKVVEQSVCALLQCARSEICRAEIIVSRMVNYCLLYCRKYWRITSILRAILKLFNWITDTQERMVIVIDAGAVRTTLKSMERHMSNAEVLAPGMHFLTRAAASHPPASDYLIRKKAIPTVIGAMKALYASEKLQLEGLKMLQALSRHPEGWRQISETKGGWQSICQGTSIGDALVHDLLGDFHNPGWCIGDTPHLPELDRNKLIAAKAEAMNSALSSSATWTAQSLKAFMGINMKDQRLAINVEFHEAYFELLVSLELLPWSGEEREYWFMRLAEYERTNEITLDDMTNTILEMRRNAARETAAKLKAAVEDDYVKPVYVMGKQITTKLLEENDDNAASELEGVV